MLDRDRRGHQFCQKRRHSQPLSLPWAARCLPRPQGGLQTLRQDSAQVGAGAQAIYEYNGIVAECNSNYSRCLCRVRSLESVQSPPLSGWKWARGHRPLPTPPRCFLVQLNDRHFIREIARPRVNATGRAISWGPCPLEQLWTSEQE